MTTKETGKTSYTGRRTEKNRDKQIRIVPRGLMIAENQGKGGPEGLRDCRE